MATTEQTDALTYIKDIIKRYGLPESLADWAWEQIIEGKSPTQVALDLEDREEFKTRFAGITIRRAKGLPAMSPAEYIEYERTASSIFRMAGLPAGFYDGPDDFANLIGNDVSVAELNDRVSQGIGKVLSAPREVRDAFGEMFGVRGDAALTAWFLDPDKAVPTIKRMAAQADIAGRARIGGIEVDAERAGELADQGIQGLQAQMAAANVAADRALFSESVSESTDLRAEREGLDAALGIGDRSQIERRRRERVGGWSGRGGAAVGQSGVVGLGTGDNAL